MTGGLELWAGAECTVRRVGDEWDDQLARSGHANRIDDIDRLASLGVRRLRFPVLWERVATKGESSRDWQWSDRWLDRVRVNGMEPIIGLLHHGCGPGSTSFLDPAFPERFARYARSVAERYPWVRTYTPINEPLTTARFSGLYGHWHPHARDDATFIRIFLTQCRAIALAMRAIREVRPDAQLLQTEDLAATHATPALADQAAFENERRWLTIDALTGRIDPSHSLWSYLNITADAVADVWCPPDIIGVNHYVTSERFLDDALDQYDERAHGGNGRQRYVDVEAVRGRCTPTGLSGLLRATWERYRVPLAITEVHLGCTREQQMRWLAAAWKSASTCREAGVPVAAVTLWSAFGAWDWASLLTRREGRYEVGAFDIRASRPRPTALAHMARDLATTGRCDHPALDGPGWWERAPAPVPGPARALAILGRGPLARAVAAACAQRALAHYRTRLDHIRDATIDTWAVVDATGWPSLAPWAICAARGIRLLSFADVKTPNGGALPSYPDALVIQAGRCFGDPGDAMLGRVLQTIAEGVPVAIDASRLLSWAYLPDLATTSLDLLIDGEHGVWPLVTGVATAYTIARAIAEHLGLDRSLLRPLRGPGVHRMLIESRGQPMPPIADALARCAATWSNLANTPRRHVHA